MDDRPPKAPAWWRTAGLTAFQVACVGYVAHGLWRERAELSHALSLSLAALVVLGVLHVVAHAQRTLEFTYMLRRLGVREPFGDGFWLTAAGYLLNHLPLNAGLIMRAALLKQDHALPYTSYISLTMVNALVNVAVGALIGLVAAGSGWLGALSGAPALALFAALAAASIAPLCLPGRFAPRGRGFVARRLRLLLDGLVLIRGNGSGLALLALLAVSRLLSTSARLWICFGALGASISLSGAALLGWGSVLFTLINITPGNLGLRELALSVVAAQLGSSQVIGMAATSMDRVVLLAYIVLVGIPGMYRIRRRGLFRTARAPESADQPAADVR
jgi:uncharacterized membrane protein YbhN (UPF0104 family)